MDLQKCQKNVRLVLSTTNKGEIKWHLYTSQKSKVTGTITEIKPNTDGTSVRVKLDVNGTPRWTTWTAK
jgi:hypothetical protein